MPATCAFGIFGNLLTTVVLVRRMKDNIDMLEKGSLMGMLGAFLTLFIFACSVRDGPKICTVFTILSLKGFRWVGG